MTVEFPPWGWILGTGTYVDDIEQEVETQRGQIARAIRAQIFEILAFTVAGCLFVATVAVVLQRRRLINRAVAASELRLRRLFEGAPDGVVIFDAETGGIRTVNPALARMLGRPPADLVGQPVTRRVIEAVHRAREENRESGYPIELGSEVIRRADGSEVYIEDTGTLLEFEGRESVAAFVRDVTARHRAEEHLRRHEQMLSTVLNHTDNALIVLDAQRRVIYYNERYAKSMGLSREFLDSGPALEEIIRCACQAGLYPADQADELVAHRLLHLESDEPEQSIETPRQDGVITEGYAARLPGGGHLLAFRDVTERVRAEKALQAEKDFSESLVRSSGVATFVLSPDHRVLSWNKACEELTGLAAEAVLGTREHWKAFYPSERPCLADLVLDGKADEGSAYYSVFGSSALNAEGLHAEGWYRKLGGVDRYLVFDAVPICSQDGRLLAAVETLQDLAALKNVEEERGLLSTAVEQSGEAIVVTDTQGVIQYVNGAFEVITGYPRSEALGAKTSLLKSGRQSPDTYRDLWTTVRRGEVWKGHMVNRRKDGTLYEEEDTISPVRDKAGEIQHLVAVKRDVTLELELERRLAESQKIEALGTLAGGIAHDFNNILTAIMGFTELALDDVPPESPAPQNLAFVLSGAARAKELVKQILTFSRREEEEDEVPENVSVGPVVEDTLRFLRASLPSTLEVRWEVEPGEYEVVTRPSHLRRVLLNLCTNAAQAMEGRGGLLEVSAAAEDLAAARDELPAGAYVHLMVRDTGPGIAPEVLGRIFEPYFTTKGVGEGSGMGLAVVHGIVQGLGGSIEVNTRPGEGTRFDLWLPRALAAEVPNDSPRAEPEPSAESATPRRGRILVVDDDAEVLEVAALFLRVLDYDVVAEPRGEGALTRLENPAEEFALLITDQSLPGLSGLELARRARTLRPGLPVILSTGDSGSVPEDEVGASFAARLEKPWSRGLLIETVHNVLGRG